MRLHCLALCPSGPGSTCSPHLLQPPLTPIIIRNQGELPLMATTVPNLSIQSRVSHVCWVSFLGGQSSHDDSFWIRRCWISGPLGRLEGTNPRGDPEPPTDPEGTALTLIKTLTSPSHWSEQEVTSNQYPHGECHTRTSLCLFCLGFPETLGGNLGGTCKPFSLLTGESRVSSLPP